MHRIDGPGATVDNKFTDGDPVGGVQATVVTDDWLNDVQENLMAVLTAAGVAPVKGNSGQLLASINGLVGKGRLAGPPQQFTASGTITKTPGVTKWRVRQWAGGGQGGGTQATTSGQVAAGGGASTGSYAEAWFDVTALVSASLVVGLGGSTGAAGAAGVAGGTSTLTMGANSLTCPGGPGGGLGLATNSPPNEGGQAGAFSTAPSHVGALAFFGTPGGGGTSGFTLSLASAQPGVGGCTPFGYARASAIPGNSVGYGSGGSGLRASISSGAGVGPFGAGGITIIEEYF